LKNNGLWRIFGIVVVIICFYFVGRALYLNWHTIADAKLKFRGEYLIVSYIFMFITFGIVAYTWEKSLAMLGEKISFLQALQINAIATLPKYAPGKVWGILGKVYLAKKEGLTEHSCIVTITLETILYLLSGLILFLLTSVPRVKSHMPVIFYLLIIPVCLVTIYPPIMIKITNFFLKLFNRPLIDVTPNYFQILLLLLLYTLSWILQGFGVFFLIRSFYPIDFKLVLIIASLHAFSWALGFISIITPAGLGVKEGVFSYFLSFFLPPGVAAITSILVRIWGTIGELIYFLFFSAKLKKYL
jgi:uncharacterized membrane protein YbhN (UPF0104 family)